jgi:hypothetical protein
MTNHITIFAAAFLLGAALAGCGRTPQPEAVPAPPPAPANAAAPAQAPPGDVPAAPAQPVPDAPPPQDSSPVPKPTSTEPALETMKPAFASTSKMGVSVDLRYLVDVAKADQPLTLHLAATPTVDGTEVVLSLQEDAGLGIAPNELSVQKTGAARVYRRTYALTRGGSAPASVRVLVRTSSAAGSAHQFFTVPLDGTSAQNQTDSVKQR